MKRKGFTIIEFVIVIILIGILMKSYLQISGNNDLVTQNEALKIAADIRYTQSLAMTHGNIYTITFSTNGSGQWQYLVTREGGTVMTNTATGSTSANVLSSTLTFSSNINSAKRISFDGRGAPYSAELSSAPLTSDATITVSYTGLSSATVTVTANTGNVTVS